MGCRFDPPSAGFPMTDPQALHRFAQTAQKWRELVERRCAHFIELHNTGRWKHLYEEAPFLRLMSEAVALTETWSRIAPRPEDDGSQASRGAARPSDSP